MVVKATRIQKRGRKEVQHNPYQAGEELSDIVSLFLMLVGELSRSLVLERKLNVPVFVCKIGEQRFQTGQYPGFLSSLSI
jgi:hypothetical protein